MKKCSRSTARSTTWSKLLAVALPCWAAASRVESWGSGGVWANTDVAQQTRESVRTANKERNIFICFISPKMRDLRCELKHDVHYRLEISRVPVFQGGLELN